MQRPNRKLLSLLKFIKSSEGHFWKFRHPTINEAVASIVVEDHELLDVYLAGISPEKLIHEVTCGFVGLEGVKVIVPENRYQDVVEKLGLLAQAVQFRFLSYRCDFKFLKLYIDRYPDILERISEPQGGLGNSSAVDLVCTLHSHGLYPEEFRQKFVSVAQRLAIQIPDSDFLKEEIRACFKENEIEETLQKIKIELVPNLKDIVNDWDGNYKPSNGSPNSHFEDLQNSISMYLTEFIDDYDTCELFEEAIQEIEDLINHYNEKYFSDDEEDYEPVTQDDEEPSDSERSIFDDVDE